jgi:acetylglutamate kinase
MSASETQVKVNPAATTLPTEVIGKTVTIFTVDYINAINASSGALGAQQAVLNTVLQMGTIILAGPLGNGNTEQTFMMEGDFAAAQLATLQADLRLLGTTGGAKWWTANAANVDVSSSTVTVKTFTIAV